MVFFDYGKKLSIEDSRTMPMTVFMVGRENGISLPNRELFTFAGWRLSNNGRWSLRRWDDNNPSILSTSLSNLHSVVGWKFDRYGYELRVNGESVGVSSSGNWHPSVVFDRINEDSSLMMGELVLYPRVLDTAETKMVEGYLAHHWNLAESLPLDHPYKAGLPSGPEGLVLQGTPSSAGTYPVSVTAGNELGSVSDTFNFTIFAVPPKSRPRERLKWVPQAPS